VVGAGLDDVPPGVRPQAPGGDVVERDAVATDVVRADDEQDGAVDFLDRDGRGLDTVGVGRADRRAGDRAGSPGRVAKYSGGMSLRTSGRPGSP
jgi:hypothetical protein